MAPGTPLRPRTVGELLDGSFFFYRRHFGRFLLMSTLVSLPTLVIAGLTAEVAAESLKETTGIIVESMRHPKTNFGEMVDQQLALQSSMQLLSLLSTVLQSLSRGGAAAVMAVTTYAALSATDVPGVWTAIRRAAPRIPAAVLAIVLQQTLIAPLAVCCLPLGVIALVIVMPTPAVIMFEQGGAERGLRTWVWGAGDGRPPGNRLFRALGVVCLPMTQLVDGTIRCFQLGWHAMTIARGTAYLFFVSTFVTFFVGAVTTAAAGALGSAAAAFWLQHYAEVLCLPVVGVSIALWYVDLRVRREAVDLLGDGITLA